MDKNQLILDLDLLKYLLNQESQKLVGKCMKRFEISDNKEEIKKAVKEIIYESLRDFHESLVVGKLIFINQDEQKRKEGEKNGK